MTYGQASCRAQDSLVLVELYNATDGANWTIRTNWLTANPLNTWYGVQVNADGCVTCLDLDGIVNCSGWGQWTTGNNLVGTLPTSIVNLSQLQFLSLARNQLTGTIPTTLGNLAELRHLSLAENQLTGTIPTSLGTLSHLSVFNVSSNRLTGSIPTELGNCTNMLILYMNDNLFTGNLPPSLGQMSQLIVMHLANNQLTGEIPSNWNNFPQMTEFWLQNNQLSGSIPNNVGSWASLNFLIIYNNQLTGTIPDTLGALRNLNYMGLGSNRLVGIIPSSLGNCIQMIQMGLDRNQLTGNIPVSLGNLGRMEALNVSHNLLSGTIPDTLCSLPNMYQLQLQNNAFTGNVPPFRLPILRTLLLNDNELQGCIPASIRINCTGIGVTGGNISNNARLSTQNWGNYWVNGSGACSNSDYVLDSTLVTCQGGCTPIRLTQSVDNINGYTIRLQFDSTKVVPDIETNHPLGRIIPAQDSVSLFQYVQNGVLVLNLSLQGWRNVSGNVGDTLICLSWKPVLTAATPSLVALTGNVEASNAAGGQTIHPIQSNIRTEINSATQFWVLYQGAGAMTQSTPTHPTVVKSGTSGNMTIRGNVSSAGLYLMSPMTGNSVQFKRQSFLSLGMPEIGGNDAYQMNLLLVDHPNAARNVSQLIAMDVNGDGLINAGDLSQVLRRAVNFQRGFRQTNSIDTMSWRHFPKYYLVSRPEYHLSTTFPNDNGVGISRLRVVKVDTLFRLDSAYYRPCDTAVMDVVAILLGDADGNYATVGTNAKGKLSGKVTFDARNALQIGQDTFQIPIYASETLFGLDIKMENHSDKLKILSIRSNGATLETNIDATTQSAYMSVYATRVTGIGMNVPIAYLTVQSKCPKMLDWGKVTSYLNGETAGTEVTSRFCSTESGVKLFPNPVHQVLTIWYGDAQPTTITVLDAIGRKVKVVEPDAEQTILDMSGLVTGIYFVQMDDKTFKIVKQ
jgi:Leucine-rich repeat (LRR) protein